MANQWSHCGYLQECVRVGGLLTQAWTTQGSCMTEKLSPVWVTTQESYVPRALHGLWQLHRSESLSSAAVLTAYMTRKGGTF